MGQAPGGEPSPPAASNPWERAAVATAALLAISVLAIAWVPAIGASRELSRMIAWAPLALGTAAIGLYVPAIRRRPALLATLVSTAVALLMVAYHFRPDVRFAEGDDASWFYRMADEWPWKPGGWWRYRILVPWVVHVLPVATTLGYALLAFLAVAAAGPLLSLLLRDLGYGTAARHAGVALYLASFAPLYNSYNYALPDPAAMAVLLLAARALVRGRDRELALWLLVGCVTKEVVLFLVPVRWLLRRGSEGNARGLLRTALVAAPAGILFLVLRLLPGEAAEYTGFVTGPAFLFPWTHQPDNVARLYSPFAAGWALVALAALRPSRWAAAGAAFALLAGASLLFTDSGRMLVYLLPFAIPMMLDAAGLGPGEERTTAAGLTALALAAISMRLWEPFLFLWRVPVEVRRGAALALLPVVALLGVRALRQRAAPRP